MSTSSKPSVWPYLGFLIVGLLCTGGFGYVMIWRPLRVNLFYVETTCVVLDKKLVQGNSDGQATAKPLIHIAYEVDGRIRQAWTYDSSGIADNLHDSNMAILAQFPKGQHCPCWYDPDDPDSAVLTRSFSLWSLMLLIPLAFTTIGAGGLIYSRMVHELTLHGRDHNPGWNS